MTVDAGRPRSVACMYEMAPDYRSGTTVKEAEGKIIMRLLIFVRVGIYGTILLVIMVLLVKARRESVFSQKRVSPILVPFRRAAVYLYKRELRRRNRRHSGHRAASILLSEQARTDLVAIDASGQIGRRTAAYMIDKIMLLILCLVGGAVIGMILALRGQQEHVLQGDHSSAIVRPSYGEGDTTVRLTGTVEGETSEYDITVSERQYTSKEAEALFCELETLLPTWILGDNQDTAHVRSRLLLASSYEDYPFTLSYSSSNYAVVRDNGTVCNDELEEGEHVDLILHVRGTYQGYVYTTDIPITVLARIRSTQERFEDAVQSALSDADADTIYGRSFYLPEVISGVRMEWSESSKDQSTSLFILVLFAGGVGCYIKDRQLREQVERRERQMTIDYPQVVSKVTLFLGAGMSIRNIFYKLGEDYQRGRDEGREIHYVYEEIQLMCRELDSGVSEISAYRNFATRCRLRPYTKFISLLTQNLQKGNNALLGALEDEASAAFEERKNIARQMGEEAGTKMLLPMMLMLIITLVIIVVPAYLGFV